MMIIEDKITEFIPKLKKTNNNIIYLVDYEIEITKIYLIKKIKRKKIRTVKLRNKLFEKNPGESNKKYRDDCISMDCRLKDNETLEIKKVILKKEISCSFYER